MIININVVSIEITEAFTKIPLGIKGFNMFLKLLGVVYMALLTTKLLCVLQKKIELKSIILYTITITIIQLLYDGGHLGRHLEYVRVLENDFLERLLC